MFDKADMTKYTPGSATYSSYGSIRFDEEISSRLKRILFITFNLRAKQSGFRWVIGRSTNIRSIKLHLNLGATQLEGG
jgi:hypothetical protein